MRILQCFCLLCFLFVLIPYAAQADCTSPDGVESQTIYDTQAHAPKFCNGTGWRTLEPWLTNGSTIYYSSGNVGIGTDTPAYTLDVNGIINAQRLMVTDAPTNPIYIIGTGGGNDDVVIKSFANSSSGGAYFSYKARGTQDAPTRVLANDYLSYIVGRGYDSASYYGGGLYQRAQADFNTSVHDTYWYFTNGSGTGTKTTLKIASTGITTIYGTSTCVIGSGTGTTSCSSDARLKTDVAPLEGALQKIVQLQGVHFRWKADPADHHIGLIAQDVESIFPEVVSTSKETGMKSIAYASLVAPLIESVKALEKENQTLKTRLEAVEAALTQ